MQSLPAAAHPRATDDEDEPGADAPRARAVHLSAAPSCVVCDAATMTRMPDDLWRCVRCGYWRATIAHRSAENVLDESKRFAGLADTRRSSARLALAILARHRDLRAARLCDVGCGYGWFLEAAGTAGMTALGIEPDPHVAGHARARGLDVRSGSFPGSLAGAECFDVVAFLDVLEHVPDVEATIAAARARLVPGGHLLLSLPSSRGLLFRSGRWLRRLGLPGAWDRLWQRRFPSPHLHFFDADNGAALLRRLGFELRESVPMPMLELRGLWSRARMDRELGTLRAVAGVFLIALVRPFLRFLPADAILQVYGVARPARGRDADRDYSSHAPTSRQSARDS